MHYLLEEKEDCVFELTCTFVDSDYDNFLEKQKEEIVTFEWFNVKAKTVHDIGKTFCGNGILRATITDSLFPTITCEIDLKHHDVSFEDCLFCSVKDHFSVEFMNYDSCLEAFEVLPDLPASSALDFAQDKDVNVFTNLVHNFEKF